MTIAPDSAAPPQRLDPRGSLLVVVGGVCLSWGGLFVRLIEEADGWQILFYRGLGFVPTLFLLVLLRERGNTWHAFRRLGWPGLGVALALGTGFVTYLFAMLHTTVANVVFIIATGPFLAALLAWIVLRERVAGVTWIGMAVSLLGIALMVAEGWVGGKLLGSVIALGVPLSFAVMVVLIRRWPQRDSLPAICLAGLVPIVCALVMVDGLAVPARDIALAVVMGSVQIGLGFAFITLGARTVPAAQVGLLALGETVLAPVWVWLFLGETPSWLTLAGGCLVLGAVAGQALVLLHRGRRARRRPAASVDTARGAE